MKVRAAIFGVIFAFLVQGQSHASEAGASPIARAIENIKSTETFSHNMGVSYLYAGKISVTVAGAGAILSEYGLEAIGAPLVRGGAKVAVVCATYGLVATAIVAVFEPTPAKAGELSDVTDYFLTPEGFAAFLKLPSKDMLYYGSMEPKLGNLLIQISDGIDRMRAVQPH